MPQCQFKFSLLLLASMALAGCGDAATEEAKAPEELQQVHQNRAERMMKEGVGK